MKTKPGYPRLFLLVSAFTRVEVVVCVVCAVILGLGIFVMPGEFNITRNRAFAQRVTCVGNLKQAGTAYIVWEGDHGDMIPSLASVTNAGLYEVFTNAGQGALCWRVYGAMSNELGLSPGLLCCPADSRKMDPANAAPSAGFRVANTNISYFVGIGANSTFPNSILGGDRNLAPGLVSSNDFGYSPASGAGNDVILSTNPAVSPICWSLKMHSASRKSGAGNLLLADCSVQQTTSVSLRSYQSTGGTLFTNRIPSEHTPPAASFRLIFP
jgi:hypothetical protein